MHFFNMRGNFCTCGTCPLLSSTLRARSITTDTYHHPVHSSRAAKSHRFDGFNRKLSRSLTLFSCDEFDQWILLETNPIPLEIAAYPTMIGSFRARTPTLL
jgi:hypothetical protein